LVELLVVIAIIALLLAVLIPSLNKARAVARRVLCSSNLSQISKAYLMYCNNNSDKMPLLHAMFDSGTGGLGELFGAANKCYAGWYDDDIVAPYLAVKRDRKVDSTDFTKTVFYCPENASKVRDIAIKYLAGDGIEAKNTFRTGYSANTHIQPRKMGDRSPWLKTPKLTMIKNTSETPLFYCFYWDPADADFPRTQMTGVVRPFCVPGPVKGKNVNGIYWSYGWPKGVPNAHKSGTNFLFLDGHVEYVKTKVPRPEYKDESWREYQDAFAWHGEQGENFDW
jgi:prepilin-type processing-associated H-X9-DG protein